MLLPIPLRDNLPRSACAIYLATKPIANKNREGKSSDANCYGSLTCWEVLLRGCQYGRLDLWHGSSCSVLPAPLPTFSLRFLPFSEDACLRALYRLIQGPHQHPRGALHESGGGIRWYEQVTKTPRRKRNLRDLSDRFSCSLVVTTPFLIPLSAQRVRTPLAFDMGCERERSVLCLVSFRQNRAWFLKNAVASWCQQGKRMRNIRFLIEWCARAKLPCMT